MEHLATALDIDLGQLSVAGIKSENEDAIGIRVPDGSALVNKGIVAIAADGVSAAEAGKEASHTAVSSFISDYYSTHDSWSVKTSGLKVITALNKWLYARGQNYPMAEKGFITTFSTLILKSSGAYIFHIGDSRIYRIREGDIEQITRDHSAPVGDGHHYLSRALGINTRLEVDFHRLDLKAGDQFLLTTDGVHNWLKSNQLLALVNSGKSLNTECKAIIDEALNKGSTDNLSAQIIRIKQAGAAEREDVLQSLNNLPFPPNLSVGSELDGWRVLKELHANARSEVYLVENIETALKAAMKVPSANYEDDPAYIERFIQEEWIGTRINSPHVVKVLPVENRHYLYYLTEYIEGPTLNKLLKERTRLAIADARDIIMQVASGLRAFHRKDCLHQDIKPDNIIYSSSGVKIIDFGSVHISGISEIDSEITREQQLGTLSYSAPEYKLGTTASVFSDQFSLGLLAYELVTGKHAFGANYEQANSEKMLEKLEYTPAHTLNPLVPIWMDGAIKRTVGFKPNERYETLSEFIQDLKKPNPLYSETKHTPLIERNPLRFWQGASLLLLIVNLVLLSLLLN